MMEFFEADLSPLGPAHAVKLGGNHGVIAALAFSGEQKADIRGGSPFDFGYILTDDLAAKFHKLNKRGECLSVAKPSAGVYTVESRLKLCAGVHIMLAD